MMEVARSFNTLCIWLDLVLVMDRLPEAGESRLGSRYSYVPGGKGANQAVAVTRGGAQPSMPRRAEVEP